ncbi:MAG: hypothetical protein OXG81_09065 [Acidobacteria bacterium]|nr:hypothetical protein [Acidobacteriota bacterium]
MRPLSPVGLVVDADLQPAGCCHGRDRAPRAAPHELDERLRIVPAPEHRYVARQLHGS